MIPALRPCIIMIAYRARPTVGGTQRAPRTSQKVGQANDRDELQQHSDTAHAFDDNHTSPVG
eukprot:m.122446 g.122446  ORF g.122446 m.122446 type:complete len:62 (-) comp11106_c0_seq3:111-296(-)